MAAPPYELLLNHCAFVAAAQMRGVLFEVDDYPGAVESERAEEKITGELYRIRHGGNAMLRRLDEYEGCSEKFPEPHEYIRKKVMVIRSDGVSVFAWIYIYNRDVSGLEQVEGGDYGDGDDDCDDSWSLKILEEYDQNQESKDSSENDGIYYR